MAGTRDDAPLVQAESVEQWRAWLVEHHASSSGVWLVSWRAQTGRASVPYVEAVEQALCVGWIDSTARRLDDERTALWFTRRKAGSGWARTNKERVERLEAAGLMLPAGRAVIDAAQADGSWSLLDEVENLVVPADLAAAFVGYPGSRERWDAFPPSARRAHLAWLAQAKRPETRGKRADEVARLAQRGERANEWVPRDKRAQPGDG